MQPLHDVQLSQALGAELGDVLTVSVHLAGEDHRGETRGYSDRAEQLADVLLWQRWQALLLPGGLLLGLQ